MSKLCVTNHIADYVLSVSESGSVHSNRFTTQDITLTLPSSASEGIYFYMVSLEYNEDVSENFTITIALGNASHQIIDNSDPSVGQSIISTYFQSQAPSIMLVFDGVDKWLATEKHGIWQKLS